MLGIVKNDRGTRLELKTAFANIAQSTAEGEVVAAVPGYRIVVLAIFAHLAGGVETLLTLKSLADGGTPTPISSTKQVSANGGFVMVRGTESDFLFSALPGEALIATTGAGSTVGIDVTYVLMQN